MSSISVLKELWPDRVNPRQVSKMPKPVAQKERIVSIDVLRGFALLGILPMNIQSFSMIAPLMETRPPMEI